MSARTPTLDIRLPDGGVVLLPIAGPATRFVAWLIDLVFVLLMYVVSSWFVGRWQFASDDLAAAVSVGMFFGVPVVYGLGFETLWRGQTPGKRLMRLRVMDAGGRRLGIHQIIIRNLLRVVDCLPYFYLVGGGACFCTGRSQRLGDLVAGTVVVRTEPRGGMPNHPSTFNLSKLV